MLTLWCFLAAPEWVVLDTFCVVHYNPLLHMDGESGGELYPCLFQGHASDSLAAACFPRRVFRRPADYAALLEILLIGAGCAGAAV